MVKCRVGTSYKVGVPYGESWTHPKMQTIVDRKICLNLKISGGVATVQTKCVARNFNLVTLDNDFSV